MPIADLSSVTATLQNLLRLNVRRLAADNTIGVSGVPPDRISNASKQLNFYLYHLAEDAHYKNALGPGADENNVALTPLALNLYYILTAHHENDNDFDPVTQQRLMGYGLKTLHDFPIISRATSVVPAVGQPGVPVMNSELRAGDNTIQVILRPITPEDALSFWSAERQQTTRLSAYYEVRVVMLEPEQPRRVTLPTLSLGQFISTAGTPYLESTKSMLAFVPPPPLPGPQAIEVSPARPGIDNAAGPRPNRHFAIEGSNLTSGLSRRLILQSRRWAAGHAPFAEFVVPVPQIIPNGWSSSLAGDEILVEIAPTIPYVGSGGPSLFDLQPGIYSVRLETTTNTLAVPGGVRSFAQRSNEVFIAIGPRILAHAGPDVNGVHTLTVAGTFVLHEPANPPVQPRPNPDPPLEIALSVAGEVYQRLNPFNAADPMGPGRFSVAAHSVSFQPPTPLTTGTYPVRLIVEGADAQPFWIIVP